MKAESRREFMRGVWRGAAAGVVGAAAVLLGRRAVRAGQACTAQGYCRRCERVADCGLPAALSARRAGVGRHERT